MVVGAVQLFPRLQQALTQFRHLFRELNLDRGRSLLEAGRKRRLPGTQQARANLLGTLLQRNAQTACNERAGQLRAAELNRACLNQLLVAVRRHIVVVAVKGALADAR